MRKSVVTGLFASAIILTINPSHADAATLDVLRKNTNDRTPAPALEVVHTNIARPEIFIAAHSPIQPRKPAPKQHIVAEQETLSAIAKKHNTNWKRIYDKNNNIENPDLLNPGETLIIPSDDEELDPRSLPEPPAPQPQPATARRTVTNSTPVASYVPPSSPNGNRYVAGYCTWYVKGRRPDLPNNLGNAATWVSRAAAQGIPTGSAPRVGAVGQRGNHVVYVESVNADGTVTVSEMNYRALYQQTSRTVPANYFNYIY